MADQGRFPYPYRLPAKYYISERIALLERFRSFHADMGSVSVQAMCDVIDDTFNVFPGWLEVNDPLFKRVFKSRLDPHTLRNLLKGKLDLGVRKIHIRSLHVIDAFLQIATNEPPKYLR